MTRIDVVALSGPQTAGTGSTGKGSPRALRRLLVLPVVLLLAAALATPALAASKEPLTTYTPTTKTEHKVLPAKEKKAPAVTPAPVTTTEPAKAASTTLPFTGFDLRWTVGIGLLLVFAGGSIMVMQRRRHDSRL
jgi:ABC-type glycerol-3-phosphate transport system substrate-binding protein